MKKRAWIAIGIILAAAPIMILWGAGHNLAPASIWAARHNVPGTGNDSASAIALDKSGNVYVTGYSKGSTTDYDYATIKYSPTGKQLWAKRYNGPGNGTDGASDIAVDGSGNVYVTGWSEGSTTDLDYATIKYSPTGKQLWVKRYIGPGKDEDWAYAMVVDASGNVYITGKSDGPNSWLSYEYATIKYNTNGKELWAKRYKDPDYSGGEACAIAADDSGNVYVTGTLEAYSFDHVFATIKYSPDGQQFWVRSYNGPGNYGNEAEAIAVDASGNVYVTGYNNRSSNDCDCVTIKYSSDGKQLWIKKYNGPGDSHDSAYDIAVDGSGNVFITGGSTGSGSHNDYTTIKYNPNGKELWVKRYNGPGNGYDVAAALAVDGSGNVYISGESDGSDTWGDYATIKYNANGQELWAKRYDGYGYDSGKAIAVDGSGNVYVTGKSDGLGTGYDYATIKYSPNGTQLWVKRYNFK
jgi:uncharacterized delta-60 repeat protein